MLKRNGRIKNGRMDWQIDKPTTREDRHQRKWHDGLKRLVLNKRCAKCNGRLIKMSYMLTPEQYEELYPMKQKWDRIDEYCQECK